METTVYTKDTDKLIYSDDAYAKLVAVMDLAEKYYPKGKFKHASRVAGFAAKDAQTRIDVDTAAAFIVGIAHDLLEDTECSKDELEKAIGTSLLESVVILTNDDDETYDEYIKSILDSGDPLAILVKRADMKDHFMQEHTLTEKLIKKYLPHIKEFL